VKTPKLYFYDTGLLCWLLGIYTIEQLQVHSPREGSKRKARSEARTWSGEPDPTVGRGTPYIVHSLSFIYEDCAAALERRENAPD
jgi:hypothetical protein